MTKLRQHPGVGDRAELGPNETDFVARQWMGKEASDFFFGLRVRPEFEGLGSDAVLLPANMLSVSRDPQRGGAVMEAYANGLVYADQLSRMNGAAAVGGLINLPLLIIGACHFVSLPDKDTMAVLALVLCVPLAVLIYFLFRFDITGYRCAPVLFDRAASRIHVFTDETALFGWWPLWAAASTRFSRSTGAVSARR